MDELNILRNFIKCMPKTYRKRNTNWNVVRDILLDGTNTAGMTSCVTKCRELELDPWGYEL